MGYNNEQNNRVLKESLKQLPKYLPDKKNWENIRTMLQYDAMIARGLNDLPTYEPASRVWINVEKHLENSPQTINIWKYAIAATLAIAVSTWLVLQVVQIKSDSTYTYHSEKVLAPSPSFNWEEDEAAIDEVLQLFADNEMLRQSTAYQDTRSELMELQMAKETLQSISTNYNNQSKDLMLRLKDIENQRTALIRQLVVNASY